MVNVIDLPAAVAYGTTREEALTVVKALALRFLADQLEHGELIADLPEERVFLAHGFGSC